MLVKKSTNTPKLHQNLGLWGRLKLIITLERFLKNQLNKKIVSNALLFCSDFNNAPKWFGNILNETCAQILILKCMEPRVSLSLLLRNAPWLIKRGPYQPDTGRRGFVDFHVFWIKFIIVLIGKIFKIRILNKSVQNENGLQV